MHQFYASLTALAVAGIYVLWSTYERAQTGRVQLLRERVTYMLWRIASNSHWKGYRGLEQTGKHFDRPDFV